jgi:hypothetical protein
LIDRAANSTEHGTVSKACISARVVEQTTVTELPLARDGEFSLELFCVNLNTETQHVTINIVSISSSGDLELSGERQIARTSDMA